MTIVTLVTLRTLSHSTSPVKPFPVESDAFPFDIVQSQLDVTTSDSLHVLVPVHSVFPVAVLLPNLLFSFEFLI